MKSNVIVILVLLFAETLYAQRSTISGVVYGKGSPIEFANVYLVEASRGAVTDESGAFRIEKITPGEYTLRVSYIGFNSYEQTLKVKYGRDIQLHIELKPEELQGNEVVVTGTMKEISRAKSPVPVEVFSPAYFKMNPTPSLYESMQNVNGVRPQLNCNVCNTGDIHINGLEGPYTMVLIDGMPIVSGLSSVYGLSGIPNSMIERVEIVKGPSSTLYGSEAIGGIINVITKKPVSSPTFLVDVMSSSWLDVNLDVGGKFLVGNKAEVLSGLNVFNYTNPEDHNRDGFTDVTLQQRVSAFQKWAFKRNKGRLFTLAGRFLYEDRWGGEMDWKKTHRGGTEVYGESIYTTRWELIGNYQLPAPEKLLFSFSFNAHTQDSYYGDTPYFANQRIGFAQLTWDSEINIHNFIAGVAVRYTHYDDNTPATASGVDLGKNKPDQVWLPGIFVQDELSLNSKNNVLLGVRYDYNTHHGNIWTPRFAYKWSPNTAQTFRLNAGTGFRVVNLFTEDHASLTGAREVVIKEKLDPEKSYNINLNYEHKLYGGEAWFVGIDATGWITYFSNQIFPDYETNSNQIIYANLEGFGVTRGVSLNLNVELKNGIKLMAGGSFIDVFTEENGVRDRPLLTERWAGTWALGIPLHKNSLQIDYTGNLYGPMELPLLNELDPRPETSPWWSLQNIQLSWKSPNKMWECYTGIKNLLNYTPSANSIARSFDPFDRKVVFDEQGNPVPTPENPYALTFDPSYVYAPNQGIRWFAGIRYFLK